MTKLTATTYRAFDRTGELIHVGTVKLDGATGRHAVTADAEERFAPRPVTVYRTTDGWRVDVGGRYDYALIAGDRCVDAFTTREAAEQRGRELADADRIPADWHVIHEGPEEADAFDEFARADLEGKGVDPAKAAEIVENTYDEPTDEELLEQARDEILGDRSFEVACRHGHYDCATTPRGACSEEAVAKRYGELVDERELREARLSGFTDEALARKADETDMPGPKRRAEILLRLDTPERRARASAEGHTLTNLHGGRPSDNLANAVAALQRAIDEGREGEELYGERTARRHRERERQFRDENPAAASAAFERNLDSLR